MANNSFISRSSTIAGTALISIIIPTYNEAENIGELLQQLMQVPASETKVEIIVVDGESSDRTPLIIAEYIAEYVTNCPVKFISTSPGRANQMNQGAKAAQGEILLFLHADSHLPNNFPTLVIQTLNSSNSPPPFFLAQQRIRADADHFLKLVSPFLKGVKGDHFLKLVPPFLRGVRGDHPSLIKPIVAGAFELEIKGNLRGLRLVEKLVNWRSHFLSLPYGDQAIFLRAETFWQLGGFPDLPIMEDFQLIQQLKKLGKVAIAPAKVQTSARRWQKLGVWQTTLINQLVIIAFFCGISPQRISNFYRRQNTRSVCKK